MIRGRVVAPPHGAGAALIRGHDRDISLLKRQQASLASINGVPSFRLGPLLLQARQNPDDSVTVLMQNALSKGPAQVLAVLPP